MELKVSACHSCWFPWGWGAGGAGPGWGAIFSGSGIRCREEMSNQLPCGGRRRQLSCSFCVTGGSYPPLAQKGDPPPP